MLKNISAGVAATLVIAGTCGTAAAQPSAALLFSGVVQSVEATEITVNGKRFASGDAKRVVPGQLVNVYGAYMRDGSIVGATVESAATYAAGRSGAAGGQLSNNVRSAGISVGGTEAEGISVGGTQAEGISVGGTQAEGISVGGTQAEGISVGGTQAEGISVGGTQAEGISVGGTQAEGISVGGGASE